MKILYNEVTMRNNITIKRFYLSLVEIMIAMLIIGLITAALAKNGMGFLNSGKQFTTEQRRKNLEDILILETQQSPRRMQSIEDDWKDIIEHSPYVSNPDQYIYDAWDNEFIVSYDNENKKIIVEIDNG
jgi:type II secretory pathway pseudopilin PulG